MVLIGHFTPLPALQWARFGVELFFALSGRLMAEILFDQRFPARQFLLRRFSRVWPGLLVFVILMLIVSRLTAALNGPFPLATAASILSFTFNYARLWGAGWEAAEHFWSLCVEEHSYLILLAVAALSGRRARVAAPILAGIVLLSTADGLYRSLMLGQDYYAVYWLTETKLPSVLVPVLAWLYRRPLLAKIGPGGAYLSAVCGLAAAALSYHAVSEPFARAITPFLLAPAIVALPEAKPWMRAVLEWRPLAALGIASYSIYVWQQPFSVLGHGQGMIVRLALLAAAVATGLASFRFVEQPARRALNRLFAPRAAIAPVPPS